MLSRTETNWMEQLTEDEIKRTETGEVFVPLKALRRLASLAGVIASYPLHVDVLSFPNKNGQGIQLLAYVTYQVCFKDESVFGATADATFYNLSKEMSPYLVACAESRAEARALRKALNLNVIANEEVEQNADVSQVLNEITQAQQMLIKKKAAEKGMSIIDVIRAVVTRPNIMSLEELTYNEGEDACRMLNQRSKNTKKG